MAQRKLVMMISSRSDKGKILRGDGTAMTLREARTALKHELESAEFLGQRLLEVWINEEEVGDHDETAWQECLTQARDCDLFVALYDGSPGWTLSGAGVGICQAEFDAAFLSSPGKVKVVRLPGAKLTAGDGPAEAFRDALVKARRFEVHAKGGWAELRAGMMKVSRELVLKAALEGTRQLRKSGPNRGLALDWSLMDFAERSAAIRSVIAQEVGGGSALENQGLPGAALRSLEGAKILFACSGAARSLGVPAARELLGRPFLRDHEIISQLEASDVIGPVHLIGTPKTVTESQAINMLGAPDVTVVSGDFGVYAADPLHRVQLSLLAGCADPGSTRNAVQSFLEWLDESGEVVRLVRRAGARRRILDTILKERDLKP